MKKVDVKVPMSNQKWSHLLAGMVRLLLSQSLSIVRGLNTQLAYGKRRASLRVACCIVPKAEGVVSAAKSAWDVVGARQLHFSSSTSRTVHQPPHVTYPEMAFRSLHISSRSLGTRRRWAVNRYLMARPAIEMVAACCGGGTWCCARYLQLDEPITTRYRGSVGTTSSQRSLSSRSKSMVL